MGLVKRAQKRLDDVAATAGKALITSTGFFKLRASSGNQELSPSAKAAAIEIFVPSTREKRSSTFSSRATSITFLAMTPQDCSTLQANEVTEIQGLANLPRTSAGGDHGVSICACCSPVREVVLPEAYSQKCLVATEPLHSVGVEGICNKFPNSMTPPQKAGTTSMEPSREITALNGIMQYTTGESRIVLVNDGTKDCVALLLTEEMVTEAMQNLDKEQQLKMMNEQYQNICSQVRLGEIALEAAHEQIGKTADEDEIDGLLSKTKEHDAKLIDLKRTRETLESQLETMKSDLKSGYDLSKAKLEKNIQKARLLNSQKPVQLLKAASLNSQDHSVADTNADDDTEEQAEASILAAKRRTYKDDLRTYYKPQYVAPPPLDLYLSSDLSPKQNRLLKAHLCYQRALDRWDFAKNSLEDWSLIYAKREARYRHMVEKGQLQAADDHFYNLLFNLWIKKCQEYENRPHFHPR